MKRNIVLVTVDSLRADTCGFMGYNEDITPTLDNIAKEGVVFENAIAPGSNTPSSMPVIFTGRHIPGVSHGITNRDTIRKHLSRTRTIPEQLSKRGYTTIGFTSNPFTSRYFGFDRGFDEFNDFIRSDRSLRNRVISHWMEGKSVAGLRFGLNMIGHGDLSLSWETYYDRLITSVKEAEQPFFLWVFLLEPHWPYRPPRRFRKDISVLQMYYFNWIRSKFSDSTPSAAETETIRTLYDATIQYIDEFLNQLLSDLSDRDPALIFHADHGEAFGEHGLYGHGHQLYEENIHVPFVLWYANQDERIEKPISLQSLPRIIDDIATNEDNIDCIEYTRPWVTSYAAEKAAIRGKTWKYIRNANDSEIYNLENDPKEMNVQTNSQLSQICNQILDHERRQKAEYHQISEAIAEIDSRRL